MEKHPESCRDVLSALLACVDFELPSETRACVESHLEGCRECLDFVESLRSVIALCHACDPGPLPARLSDRARSELERIAKDACGAAKSVGPMNRPPLAPPAVANSQCISLLLLLAAFLKIGSIGFGGG